MNLSLHKSDLEKIKTTLVERGTLSDPTPFGCLELGLVQVFATPEQYRRIAQACSELAESVELAASGKVEAA